MTQADQELLLELKQIILRHVPGATLLLYGSAARGERRPDSDYDVLVLTDEKLTSKEEDVIYDSVFDLELDRAVLISIMFYTRSKWNSFDLAGAPFHHNVEQEAIAL